MASENCRVCQCSFQTKFVSFSQKEGYLPSKNLFKPSSRKDCRGVVLAEVLNRLAFPSNVMKIFQIACAIPAQGNSTISAVSIL